ncbi:MAG: ABC transporter substrate-binding protein [Clostridia bacterium]|nr:ABC transporter substrate-binding protein [Clostridia bacterium]
MSKKIVFLFLTLLMAVSVTCALGEGRLVALTPSDCEILCAIGCEDRLVGRGMYCDYPESIQHLPVVHSGAEANIEEILALEPDIVFMSDMADTDDLVVMLEANQVKVVVNHADTIPDVYESIRMIGVSTGKEQEAEKVINDMQSAFEAISARSASEGKTIYFEVTPLQWGLWSAGNGTFMDELASICGLNNVFADTPGWFQISQEQVIARNPDYIVSIAGMGESAVEEILNRPGWEDLTAVKNGHVFNADSNAIARPGPRLKDAALELFGFISGSEKE